jgi:hypothetical protein
MISSSVVLVVAVETGTILFVSLLGMAGGAVMLIGVFIFYRWSTARERSNALAQLAAKLGFRFYRTEPCDSMPGYSHFEVFKGAINPRAINVLAGLIEDRVVYLFDYTAYREWGRKGQRHLYQVAILELPISAPRLTLRRENVIDKAAAWVGHDHIGFESAEFSRLTFVKCTEPRFAHDILHARLIDYLLGCGDIPRIEMNGSLMILATDPGGPEAVERLLAIGQEIIRSIPDYVLHERGIQAAGGKA